MDLDLSANPGQYRDAVRSLSKTAGFTLDARFPPIYRDSRRDRVSVWGWVPAAQVPHALTLPGVERLEAALQPQAAAPAAAAEADWRLVLRLPPSKGDAEDPAADFAGTLLRLSEAGFAWKRSEPRDSAGLVAVVGTMPARSLKRVLADSSVVRVEPIHPAPAAPLTKPVEASSGPGRDLIRFASSHPVFLLLLALVPLVGRLAASGRSQNMR